MTAAAPHLNAQRNNAGAETRGVRGMNNLGRTLAAYQKTHDVDGKTLAREIGLSESSLTRIKQGKLPDATNLARIINWLVVKRSYRR